MMFLYSLCILHENNIQKAGVREIVFLLTGAVIDLILLPLEILLFLGCLIYYIVKNHYK